ncbi:MAG TPA: DUF4922 domain-containing protein, partial [Draconibacterium sp.]|nr:DUF4922 domain-containing protein [Draconibacterium sp.]
MLTKKIITLEELAEFGFVENINEQAMSLVAFQKTTWETAAKNYEALNRVQTKIFDFGHFRIVTQFNAERVRSSA